MTSLAVDHSENNLAQVAISKNLLEQLITKGVVHGNELKCLNPIAKNVIWQTLLNNSINVEY